MKMVAKILLIFCGLSIFHLTGGSPTRATLPYKPEHCVRLTSENEAKINKIIMSLSDYLYSLSAEYEGFDIRLVKIDIEGHSEDEVEEKETEVQVVVNDCGLAEDESVVEDGQVVEIEYTDAEKIANENVSKKNSQTKTVNNNSKTAKTVSSESSNITNNVSVNKQTNNNNNSIIVEQSNGKKSEHKNGASIGPQSKTSTEDKSKEKSINSCNNQNNKQSKPGVRAELNLDEEGQKLLEKVEKNRGKSTPLLFYVQKDSMVFLN